MNVDGYSPKEVAQVCDITYGNARKKWHDIKKKLNEDEYIHKRAKEMGLVA